MTIHDFDMARYLIGSEVEEVYATGGVMVDPKIGEAGDIDTALVTLRYANGAIGSIDNSRQAVYGYDQRVEVFGEKGGIVVSNKKPDNAIYSDTDGVHTAKPVYFFIERYTDAYVAELKEFIACLAEDETPSVTGTDGRVPVVMGLAAWRSYRENRPVKLSEVE
jgi:myo-inositol 2-dehydrogenase/D-chiro-inositol 1-dehydrogenase